MKSFILIFFRAGRCGQGGGSSQGGQAERLCVAENGRVQPGEDVAQAGRPDGEGSAPAGGGLLPHGFYSLPTLVFSSQ